MNMWLDITRKVAKRLLHDHKFGEWEHSIPEPMPGGNRYCRWVKRCECGATRHKWEHEYDMTRIVSETYPVHDSFPHTITGYRCIYCGDIKRAQPSR